jgi:ammonia channel protein AmtB
VAAGVVASCRGIRAGVVAGLVTVAPIAALDALGWSLGIGVTGALVNVLFLDGFGIAIGSLLALTGSGRTDSRSTAPSP